jgi:CTP-dependent riboflavin kinase
MSEMVDLLPRAGLHRLNLLDRDFVAKYKIIYDKFFAELYHFDVFLATLNVSVKQKKSAQLRSVQARSGVGGLTLHHTAGRSCFSR